MLPAAFRRFYPSSTRYIVRPLLLLFSYSPLPIALRSSSLPRALLRLVVVAVVFWALSAAAGPVSRSSPLNIDRAPAPPPKLGPPLSRNASRDKSLLGAQIGAIVGAYALFIFVLACYVAIVGRRLRAYALGGPATTSSDIEMGKASPTTTLPAQHHFEPSPVSPGTTAFANSASPSNAGTQGGHFAWPSPTKQNFAGAFDERVIQEDKAQRERDMERLYAAVMEHEATSASTSSSRDLRRGAAKDDSAVTGAGKPAAAAAATASSPKRKTPRFLRALTSPTLRSPTKSQASQASQPGSPLSPKQQKQKSKKDDEALQSPGSSGSGHKRGGIRGLSISKPVPTPTFSLQSRGPASDEEPLTPRHPPPSPPTGQDAAAQPTAAASASTDDIQLAALGEPHSSSSTPVSSTGRPRVPALQLSKPRPRATTPASAGKSNSSLPLSPPQSPPPPSHQQQQQQLLQQQQQYPQYQQHHPQSSNISLPASSSTTLPLRQQQQPQQLLHNSPSSLPLRSLSTALGANPSASTTKVTIVERPDRLSSAFLSPATAGGTRRATSGLRTGQPVPYSPYMPFTPVTPITPGLVSRRDRKAREKREERTADGHRARKVVTEMVKGDDELWSSGY